MNILGVFGNRVFYAGDGVEQTRMVPDGADLTAALLQVIEEAGERPHACHMVYQPSDLQVIAAECANVGRTKLQAYFSGEYGELADPATCWGATKPMPQREGKYMTVLHYEQRPRLESLMYSLAEQGIRIRAVLPPAAVLLGQPHRVELAILAADDFYLFYHLNELGIPMVRPVRGVDVLTEHVGTAVASRRNPPEQVLIVSDPPAESLVDCLRTHALEDKAKKSPWAEFLKSGAFSAADPANLAIRPFHWKPQHTLMVASVALTLCAGALTYTYATALYHAHELAQRADQRKRELQERVARLEKTEQRYRTAEALVTAVPVSNPRPSILLEGVTQAMPPPLQLQGFRLQNGQFTLEGIAYEGIGQEKGPFGSFLDALGAGTRPWGFKASKAALSSSTWTLNGTLNP